MINGIININKPKGYTSHDVVARIRGILRQKKVGHTGTLDPDASGVLPICLGNATKLSDMLSDKSKEYIAEFILGKETDTQDISGKVLREIDINEEYYNNNKDNILDCIKSFEGEYMQVPPMYSAKKINGKKLVDLARQGIEIERKPVKIHINQIKILDFSFPYIKILVSCSKGTYIRTLCHDIGIKLNVFACMSSLVRTRVSSFNIEDSISLEQLENIKDDKSLLNEYLVKVQDLFTDYKSLFVREAFHKLAINGNKLPLKAFYEFDKCDNTKKFFKLYLDNEKFLGIYEYIKNENLLKPYKLFIGDIND